MTKTILLASVFALMGAAAFAQSEQTAPPAEAKNAEAAKKERCERNAMLHLYTGRQKDKYIRECLARKEEPAGKAAAREPGVHPSGREAAPRITPLGPGNPPSTSTGSTAPSNAAVAPSAPVTGSAGTARPPGPVPRPQAARAAAASAAPAGGRVPRH